MRIVNTMVESIPNNLREKHGNHNRHDQLQRSRGFHDQHSDRQRHSGCTAQRRSSTDDRICRFRNQDVIIQTVLDSDVTHILSHQSAQCCSDHQGGYKKTCGSSNTVGNGHQAVHYDKHNTDGCREKMPVLSDGQIFTHVDDSAKCRCKGSEEELAIYGILVFGAPQLGEVVGCTTLLVILGGSDFSGCAIRKVDGLHDLLCGQLGTG